MRRWDPLNARQLAVLQRIGAGDNFDSQDTGQLRRSAGVLRDRGLASISKRDGWHAALTDAGRYYLEHGCHPEHPKAPAPPANVVRSAKPRPAQLTAPTAAAAGPPQPRRPPHKTARIAAERQAEATELMAKLVAEGQVVVPNPDEDTVTKWRQVVDFAKRHHMAPSGKRIVKSREDGCDLRIELVEGLHPNSRPDLDPSDAIVVPAEVSQLHPLLRHLTPQRSGLDVSNDSFPRAVQMLHALLTAATERRYDVAWTGTDDCTATVTVFDHRQEMVLREEYEKRDVLPSGEDEAIKDAYSWQRVHVRRELVPTRKLRIELATDYEFSGRHRTWADRRHWNLEDKLGDVLAEIEARGRLDRERKRAEQEARDRRRCDWEVAMAAARQDFHQAHRATALNAQLGAWEQAGRIRAYCHAQEQAAVGDPTHATAMSSWLAWCRSYADQLDPIGRDDLEPELVEPRRQDLRPYLGQWSPYGPEER